MAVALDDLTINVPLQAALPKPNIEINDDDSSMLIDTQVSENPNDTQQNSSATVDRSKAATPLDKTIINVLKSLPSEQHLKRAVSQIICSGGYARIPELELQLSERLRQDPMFQEKGLDRLLKIRVGAREMDPRHLAWKGASIMGRLDCAQDGWILEKEWAAFGVRALRDKITFLWYFIFPD